jgi:hypothetical protein
MTYDEKPMSAAARIDEQEHIRRVAEDLAYAAQYGGKIERPPPPDAVRRRDLDGALETLGRFIGKTVKPIDARVAVLEGAAGRGITKFAVITNQLEYLAERISKLESETRVRFMGIWQAGFSYEKGALVTYDGSMWYCLCGTDSTKPGTGEVSGCSDWQLVVKRGRDGRGAR